jgi:hypothetical protein
MAKLSSNFYRYFMFLLGIMATVAYRIIVVLNHYSPVLVQIAWYAGTIGFVWYFAHRFKVENRRDILITKLELTKKIEKGVSLDKTEKEALVYILKSLQTSLSKWNYIAIFILSTLALVYGLYQDFIISIL